MLRVFVFFSYSNSKERAVNIINIFLGLCYVEGESGEEGYTALEKHVAFFDRNGDGVIYPWETYHGIS